MNDSRWRSTTSETAISARASVNGAADTQRSRPVAGGPLTRPAAWRGEVGELAEQRAGVAGIDELLDEERLGGAQRRPHLVEAAGELGQEPRPLLGRTGGVELGAVGGLDAALERQRT